MAELVTFVIGLPALYGIGLFYARLGGWAWLAIRRARQPTVFPASVEQVPQDRRHNAALATAQGIIRLFVEQPDMQRHERLASVTYAILEAMNRLEDEQQP